MIDRTGAAITMGVLLAAAIAVLLAYRIVLYGVRRSQRGMSTRQRQRSRHWAIRIDDAIRSRRAARIRTAEKRQLQRRRRPR